MDYAHRYINRGLVSAFLEGIYCLHTGRLTSQREDLTKLNAYALNNECQFTGKEEQIQKMKTTIITNLVPSKIKTFIVNLDDRKDRWENFETSNGQQLEFLKYQRFSAVDGKKLVSTCQLQQIFENNDYQMRRGMVGCFMSHVKLYCDLINESGTDSYLILEDDIELTNDFEQKYNALVEQLSQESNWAFCFLGHHIRDLSLQDIYSNKTQTPKIDKINTYKSFILSLGGTTGYLISKRGAKDFLDFLDSTGATNGIDTCIQKCANNLNVYYPTPHLIFSECCRNDGSDKKIDSDIQFDYSLLEKTIEDRIADEIKFYQEENKVLIHIYEFDNVTKYITKANITHPSYYKDDDLGRIKQIQETSIHPYYMVGKNCIFIVPQKMRRYVHRYKIDDVYSVEDAIIL